MLINTMQLNKRMLSLVYTNFFLLYFWPPSFPNPDSVPVRIREQTNNNHQQMVGHY